MGASLKMTTGAGGLIGAAGVPLLRLPAERSGLRIRLSKALAKARIKKGDKFRTDTQAPPARRPDQPPPADPGMIPLTIPEIKRLFNAATPTTPSLPHTAHWSAWRRRHQARARRFHKRARLATT
ncbi:hypothetical protein [Nonomuraea sp. NPDC049141]|uniref:hypothetical protein n=1 Tax=unclassified Nonomuraea TaxID=2593643 RepID=UPI0033EF4CD3